MLKDFTDNEKLNMPKVKNSRDLELEFRENFRPREDNKNADERVINAFKRALDLEDKEEEHDDWPFEDKWI